MKANKSNLFNEFIISVFLYLMLSTIEINGENKFREEIGWCLLGVVMFTITFNLFKAIFRDINAIRQKISGARKTIKSTINSKIEVKYKEKRENIIIMDYREEREITFNKEEKS